MSLSKGNPPSSPSEIGSQSQRYKSTTKSPATPVPAAPARNTCSFVPAPPACNTCSLPDRRCRTRRVLSVPGLRHASHVVRRVRRQRQGGAQVLFRVPHRVEGGPAEQGVVWGGVQQRTALPGVVCVGHNRGAALVAGKVAWLGPIRCGVVWGAAAHNSALGLPCRQEVLRQPLGVDCNPP